jgi:hypothetical protein
LHVVFRTSHLSGGKMWQTSAQLLPASMHVTTPSITWRSHRTVGSFIARGGEEAAATDFAMASESECANIRVRSRRMPSCQNLSSYLPNCWMGDFSSFAKKWRIANGFDKLLKML